MMTDAGTTSTGAELFFGLVSATGTNLTHIGELIASELRRVNYTPITIRVSDLFGLAPRPEDERISDAMDEGDRLRRTAERGDAAMLLSLAEIKQLREEKGVKEGEPLDRHAYIIHSLKHPEELNMLRRIYGNSLFIVSVYYSKESRLQTICERIARSRGNYETDQYVEKAKGLIDRDENDSTDPYGQNVRSTFPNADIFISAQSLETIRPQIERFIKLIFNHPFVTPTMDEYGMFHASAAALRSADLSRQVGAVIANRDGDIIAAGCNEVPKQGGGSVWSDVADQQSGDYRDHKIGYDSTARMKHSILSEVFELLAKEEWLSETHRKMDVEYLVDEALFSNDAILKKARISNVLEFGRTVHAEMSALMDSARRGVSVKGCKLYTTTFPCHMCARYIISAAIEEVFYIDPYPKSLAKELYPKEICVDDDTEADSDAVFFKPFIGVAPRRYFDLFEMSERKDERGYALQWKPENAQPQVEKFPTYFEAEDAQLEWLRLNREKLGLAKNEH